MAWHPLVAGGSDLAKLKSLLYESGEVDIYIYRVDPDRIFQNIHCSCKLSRILFFPRRTSASLRSSAVIDPRLDRTDFWEISTSHYKVFRWEMRVVVRDVIVCPSIFDFL